MKLLLQTLLITLAFQINNTNTAQEEKISDFYQPASLQDLSLAQVGPQLVDILMLGLTHNIDLNNLSTDENTIIQSGLTYDQPFEKFINSYTTPLKKLTLLDIATICNNTQIVDYLLRAGADVNKLNNNGTSTLMHAVDKDAIDVIPLLLKAGANINQGHKYQRTPLFTAVINFKMNIIPLLLEAGADVNKNNNHGETLLHRLTTVIYNIDKILIIAQKLLNAGANINIQNNYGETPLHTASEYNSPTMVKFLLNAGADTSILDRHGHTALEKARNKKIRKIFNDYS